MSIYICIYILKYAISVECKLWSRYVQILTYVYIRISYSHVYIHVFIRIHHIYTYVCIIFIHKYINIYMSFIFMIYIYIYIYICMCIHIYVHLSPMTVMRRTVLASHQSRELELLCLVDDKFKYIYVYIHMYIYIYIYINYRPMLTTTRGIHSQHGLQIYINIAYVCSWILYMDMYVYINSWLYI
jgi:hypothetical protein